MQKILLLRYFSGGHLYAHYTDTCNWDQDLIWLIIVSWSLDCLNKTALVIDFHKKKVFLTFWLMPEIAVDLLTES